jgi:hypothetical protein
MCLIDVYVITFFIRRAFFLLIMMIYLINLYVGVDVYIFRSCYICLMLNVLDRCVC